MWHVSGLVSAQADVKVDQVAPACHISVTCVGVCFCNCYAGLRFQGVISICLQIVKLSLQKLFYFHS